MFFEIRRKMFHLLAFVYVAGVYFLPRRTFIFIVVALLAIDTVTEILRLHNPRIAATLQEFWGGLFRKEEGTRLSGIFWMLLGVLFTAITVGPTDAVITILLYLILGDA